jgi:hypothetical protein
MSEVFLPSQKTELAPVRWAFRERPVGRGSYVDAKCKFNLTLIGGIGMRLCAVKAEFPWQTC